MFQFVKRLAFHSTLDIDMLVRDVAQQSVAGIGERLGASVHGMGPAEARGYIRARGGRVVRRQVATLAAGQGGLPATLQDLVERKALERAVHLVLRDLWTRPAAQFGWRLAG